MGEGHMLRFEFLFIAAALTGTELTAAAEGELPKFDIATTCRSSGSLQTPAKCMEDEQVARDQLQRLWPQFRQADASRCVQITTNPGGAAGYVELLTCLQAARVDEKKPTDPLGPLPTIAK
jgi:hypothetical protein